MRIALLLSLLPALALADVTVNGSVKVTAWDAGQQVPVLLYGTSGKAQTQSYDGRMLSGEDTLISWDPIEGTQINGRKWLATANVHAVGQTAGAITWNNASSTAIGATFLISVNRFSPFHIGYVVGNAHMNFTNCSQANVVCEWGFGTPGGTAAAPTAPTDGAFMRITGAGTAVCVANVNGVENTVALSAVPTSGTYYRSEIKWNNERVECLLEDASTDPVTRITATVAIANSAIGTSLVQRQPYFARLYKTATGGTAPLMTMTEWSVVGQVFDMNRSFSEQRILDGEGIERTSAGFSSLFAPTMNTCNTTGTATNSTPRVRTTNPGSACGNLASCTLSNTAACYANTFAGGWMQIATVACPAAAASCGEWIAFGYLVPTGRTMMVTGIDIDCFNQGAAVTTTATVLHWVLGTNSNAVSLANEVESATVYEYEKRTLGSMTAAVAVPLGGVVGSITKDFGNRPVAVFSGRYMTVIGRIVLSSATAAEFYQCLITPTGYFEN